MTAARGLGQLAGVDPCPGPGLLRLHRASARAEECVQPGPLSESCRQLRARNVRLADAKQQAQDKRPSSEENDKRSINSRAAQGSQGTPCLRRLHCEYRQEVPVWRYNCSAHQERVYLGLARVNSSDEVPAWRRCRRSAPLTSRGWTARRPRGGAGRRIPSYRLAMLAK